MLVEIHLKYEDEKKFFYTYFWDETISMEFVFTREHIKGLCHQRKFAYVTFVLSFNKSKSEMGKITTDKEFNNFHKNHQ